MSEETVDTTANEVTDTTQTDSVVTENEDSLPKWAREKLTKANKEAASYRTAARDARIAAEAEVKTELTSLRDEKAAVQAEADRYKLGLMKVEAALGVGIPGESMSEFTARLQGETLEDLQQDAEKLKSLFGVNQGRVRPVDRSQGQGNGATDANDPATAFEQFFKNALRGRG